jgi:putative ABC transport system permease protein
MFKNNFKVAWRNIWNNKLFAGVNIFGLSIGIACLVALFQFISYHLSFDKYHVNSDHLYRVVTELHLPDGSIEYDPGASIALGERMKNEIPQVEEYALLLKKRSFTVKVGQGSSAGSKLFLEDENVGFANPQWLKLFDYEWLQGDKYSALEEPNTAVITQKLANKYYEGRNPVGDVITLDDTQEVKIVGVIENYPSNTDTKVDIFLSLSSFKNFYPDIEEAMTNNWDWVSSKTSLFVLLNENASPEQVDDKISDLTRRNMGNMADIYQFHIQPLKEIHFDTRYDGVVQKSMLIALVLVGLLLIIIVSVNFINLSTAQSTKRSKEIGVRKALGSSKEKIFWQFIMETTFITLIGFVLALVWVVLLLPHLNDWLQIHLSMDVLNNFTFSLSLIGFLVLIIFGAGFYPAMVLSRMKPISVLKSQLGQVQSSLFSRKLLIVVQNVFAQLLIICTFIIAMQLDYLKTTDLGFAKDMILMVPVPDPNESKVNYLNNQLESNSDIVSITFCSRPPSSEGGGGTIKYNNGEWLNYAVRSRVADEDYLKTFDLQLLEGRNIQNSDSVKEILVNEQLVNKLGVQSPRDIIGNTIVVGEYTQNPATIVGVVKDFHTSYLYSPIEPLLITSQNNLINKMAVKINSGNLSGTIANIEDIWKSVYPNKVFEYNFLSDQIDQVYQKEGMISKLINSSAAVAILLSCLGWLGLISLVTVQRAKEISIRKIYGSSSSKIILLLFKDFLKLVAIAALIASPVAWYVMNLYLQGFTYRIEIKWWLFVFSAVLSALLVLLTIIYQAYKASKINPIYMLKAN